MDDHAEKEDIYVLQGLRHEKVVILVGDAGRDRGGKGGHIWASAFDGIPEILDDEFEVRESVG